MPVDSIVVDPPTTSTQGDNSSRAAPQSTKELPPQYQGKSLEDVINMHQEATRALGSKNDELGQWRSLVNDLAQARQGANGNDTRQPAQPPVTDDDFFKSPLEATRKVIESAIRDAVAPLTRSVETTAIQSDFERFKAEHPDFDQTARSPEFREWVNRSQYRQGDSAAAAKGDLNAARRLLTDWAEVHPNERPTETPTARSTPKQDNLDAARAAATDRGGRRTAPAPQGERMSRSQVLNDIISNYDLYSSDAYQNKLKAAIREGRFDE